MYYVSKILCSAQPREYTLALILYIVESITPVFAITLSISILFSNRVRA